MERSDDILREAADESDPEEREALLRACVEKMLAVTEDGDSTLGESTTLLGGERPTDADTSHFEKVGDTIGPYTLIEKLGEGGFGVVFSAEQRDPIVRRVALKVIKQGMDTREIIARFELERQALAVMEHPSIAKVFDAGATPTGRPYFAMEFAEGVPITQFCDENELDTKARLKLFLEVCSAVSHAHQKGIIHRDLKPSNIIVGDVGDTNVVKVIDFGIAKAIEQRLTDESLHTRSLQFIGTPLYVSPEQASLSGVDVDTRSDIYSLGVLLYELLVGKPPIDPRELFNAGFDEMRRMICEEEATKPSTRYFSATDEERSAIAKARQTEPRSLRIALRGDLDWIVLKTLEKERARRYDSADALSLDIQRYLTNETVSATPPSATYKIGKFIRRNRIAVTAVLAVSLALIAGIVGSTWFAFRERDRVEEKNALLVQTARSDREVGMDLLDRGRERDAMAYFARSCRNDPSSPTSFETSCYALNDWHYFDRINVFNGHEGPISHVEFSQDGNQIVSASSDGTTRIWACSTGRLMATLDEPDGGVEVAHFSPDGLLIFTTSSKGTSRIWRIENGEVLSTFEQANTLSQPHFKGSAQFSPDSSKIVACVETGVKAWSCQSGQLIDSTPFGSSQSGQLILPAEFTSIVSPFGFTRVNCGKNEGPFVVTQTGKSKFSRPVGYNSQSGLGSGASPRSTWLLHEDSSTIGIYDAKTAKLLNQFMIPAIASTAARLSPDGLAVIVGLNDGTTSVFESSRAVDSKRIGWNSSPKLLCTLFKDPLSPNIREVVYDSRWEMRKTGSPYPVSGAIFAPDGLRAMTVVGETIRIWEPANGRQLGIVNHSSKVRSAQFSPDGRYVVAGTEDSEVHLWETRIRPPLAGVFSDMVPSIAWSKPGDAVTDSSAPPKAYRNQLEVFDMNFSVSSSKLEDASAYYQSDPWVAYSTDKRIAFTASKKFSDCGIPIEVWDAHSGKVLKQLPLFQPLIRKPIASRDGAILVTAQANEGLTVWDVWSDLPRCHLETDVSKFDQVHISPDGSQIITISRGGTALVHDTHTGKIISALGSSSLVTSGEFSKDGRYFVFTEGSKVTVWDTSAANPVSSFDTGRELLAARFSPDGERLLTSAANETHVWDWEAREQIATLRIPGWRRTNSQFNATGDRIATRDHHSEGGRIWLAVNPVDISPKWWPAFLELLSRRHLDDSGLLADLTESEISERRAGVAADLAADNSQAIQIARWYLDPPESRRVSPNDEQKIKDLADHLITLDAQEEALNIAYHLNPSHPLIHIALSRHEPNATRAKFLREYGIRRLHVHPELLSRGVRFLGINQDRKLLDIIEETPELNSFAKHANSTGLAEKLDGENPFIVFAYSSDPSTVGGGPDFKHRVVRAKSMDSALALALNLLERKWIPNHGMETPILEPIFDVTGSKIAFSTTASESTDTIAISTIKDSFYIGENGVIMLIEPPDEPPASPTGIAQPAEPPPPPIGIGQPEKNPGSPASFRIISD